MEQISIIPILKVKEVMGLDEYIVLKYLNKLKMHFFTLYTLYLMMSREVTITIILKIIIDS